MCWACCQMLGTGMRRIGKGVKDECWLDVGIALGESVWPLPSSYAPSPRPSPPRGEGVSFIVGGGFSWRKGCGRSVWFLGRPSFCEGALRFLRSPSLPGRSRTAPTWFPRPPCAEAKGRVTDPPLPSPVHPWVPAFAGMTVGVAFWGCLLEDSRS